MGEIGESIKVDCEKSFQTTRKIVLIQLFSTIILIVLGWFFAGVSDNSVSEKAILLMWLTIVLIIVASFILRRVLFSWTRLRKIAEQGKLFESLQNSTVILCLFAVIIAINGFLIATLTGNRFEMLRAGAIAIVVFLFNFPRRTIWQKIVAYLERGLNRSNEK